MARSGADCAVLVAIRLAGITKHLFCKLKNGRRSNDTDG